MSNLLKVDLYKMFKTKSFYITGFILILLIALISAASFYLLIDYYHKLGDVVPDPLMLSELGIDDSALKVVASNLSSVVIFCSIFIIMFTCSEFSFGTIKNIASKGYHRESIYLSKFICGIVTTIIYTVLTIATILILAVTIVGDKIPHYFDIPSQFFPSVFLTLLTSIAYLSLVLMLASLIKSTGAALGVFFIISSFAKYFMQAVDAFFKYIVEIDFSISKYSLSSSFGTATSVVGQPSIPNETLTLVIAVAIGFLVVTNAIGLYVFRKRDL